MIRILELHTIPLWWWFARCTKHNNKEDPEKRSPFHLLPCCACQASSLDGVSTMTLLHSGKHIYIYIKRNINRVEVPSNGFLMSLKKICNNAIMIPDRESYKLTLLFIIPYSVDLFYSTLLYCITVITNPFVREFIFVLVGG